jgi:hypothetical protein
MPGSVKAARERDRKERKASRQRAKLLRKTAREGGDSINGNQEPRPQGTPCAST